MKKYFAVLLVIALLLASCDMMQDAVRSVKKDTQSGYGTVQVVLTGGEEARTVFPSLEFDKVVYTFEKSGSVPLILEPDDKGFFALELGQWQVTVEAYTEAGGILYLVASDKSGLFTVNSNTVLQVPILLKAVDETSGSGTFAFSISYPEGAELERLTLINLSSNSAVALSPGTDGYSIAQTLAVPAGYYQFTIRLRIDSRQAGISEVVHIYARATTEYNKIFTGENFSYRTVSMSGFDITGLGIFTYSGSPIGVTIEPQPGKSPGEITIYYEGDNGNSYQSPAAPVNAGTYTVTFDVAAALGFEAVKDFPAGTLTINKKQVVISVETADKVYDGTTVATPVISLLGVIGDDDVEPILGTATFASAMAGNGIVVTFSGYSIDGASVANYVLSAQPTSVTANIDKANPTVTFPAGATLMYGQSLSQAVLIGQNNTTPGTFAFSTPSTTPTVSQSGTNYSMTFTPTDTANYNTPAAQNVPVTVNKAPGAVVNTPTLDSKTHNNITLNAVGAPTNGQTVEYARNTINAAPSSGWQTGLSFSGLNVSTTYYLFARSQSNTNYNAGMASEELVITTYATQPPNAGAVITSLSGMKLAWIPAGNFQMGSPTSEIGRSSGDRELQHSVTLTNGYYMGVYQVTQKQYFDVMGGGPMAFYQASYDVGGGSTDRGRGDNYPMYYVRWYDALVFCNKLSVAEGLSPAYSINGSTDPVTWGSIPTSSNPNFAWDAAIIVAGSTGYRLPTEAQWEYACRSGTTTAFNNGTNDWNTINSSTNLGWFSVNSGSTSHAVGGKLANAWGLYDMHGNVYEWCWDSYDYNYYSISPSVDPTGPVADSYRANRGGGWSGTVQNARSAYRSSDYPYFRYYNLGFRLMRP